MFKVNDFVIVLDTNKAQVNVGDVLRINSISVKEGHHEHYGSGEITCLTLKPIDRYPIGYDWYFQAHQLLKIVPTPLERIIYDLDQI